MSRMHSAHRRRMGMRRDLRPKDEFLTDSDRYHGISMLPLAIISTDGGEHDEHHTSGNMLAQNMAVYCTVAARNVNVIMRIAPQPKIEQLLVADADGAADDVKCQSRKFIVTHLVATAPESQFTAPIGDGLVFVTDEEPIAANTASFNDMTESEFRDFVRRKRRNKETFGDYDPVGFFSVDEATAKAVVRLDCQRSGKYVLVKLLRARDCKVMDLDNEKLNIDIEYFGLKGYEIAPRGFPTGDDDLL